MNVHTIISTEQSDDLFNFPPITIMLDLYNDAFKAKSDDSKASLCFGSF